MDVPLYLSVVLPVYNEGATLSAVVSKCADVLTAAGIEFEIIVVDDASTDDTRVVAEQLSSRRAGIARVFRHPYNKGLGSSLKTGINNARGEWICCMDADGQHDPADILTMLEYVDRFDLIVGARPFGRQSLHREFANVFYNRFASWVTKFPIEDLTSGYRLFRASAIRRFLHLFPARFSSSTTSTMVLLKTGYNLKFVPINISPRQAGVSKISIFRDGLRFLLIILKVMLLFDSLRVFFWFSSFSFFLAFLSFAYTVITLERLHVPNSSVILATTGLLILALGFLSEQITALQISLFAGGNEKSG
jgi:glycosyltransferase involved in cell wall biosynthesis